MDPTDVMLKNILVSHEIVGLSQPPPPTRRKARKRRRPRSSSSSTSSVSISASYYSTEDSRSAQARRRAGPQTHRKARGQRSRAPTPRVPRGEWGQAGPPGLPPLQPPLQPSSAPEVHSLTARTVSIDFAWAATHPDFDLDAFQNCFRPDKVRLHGMILVLQTEHPKNTMKKHMTKATPRRINIFASGKDFGGLACPSNLRPM